ncbi:uncharacterized protein [Paralichthys olivaceus]|uniref:uncharacterized protein n=1 Tax=Paralichthys olivaceus TaxID=8255 RepID=UPI00375225DF
MIYILSFVLASVHGHTHTHTLTYSLTLRPLISTPTVETTFWTGEFVLPVLHLTRRFIQWCLLLLYSGPVGVCTTRLQTMSIMEIPILEIFLGTLGFGLSIMFCTTFCRACSRLREEQIEREVWRRSEQDGRPPSIYFIPFHGSIPPQDSEEVRVPRYSEEVLTPPQYNAVYAGPPPAYNELGFKPEDLPPAYTEHNVPVHPITPQPHTDVVQTVSQP